MATSLASSKSDKERHFSSPNGLKIIISHGDITETVAEAIVVPEGKSFAKRGFVANKLTQVNKEFAEKRDKLIVEKKGSFQLWQVYTTKLEKSRLSVIHAVLSPRKEDHGTTWRRNMEGLYQQIFQEADTKGFSDLAVPLLGSGKGKADATVATEVAMTSVIKFKGRELKTVRFVSNNNEIVDQMFLRCEDECAGRPQNRTSHLSSSGRPLPPVPNFSGHKKNKIHPLPIPGKSSDGGDKKGLSSSGKSESSDGGDKKGLSSSGKSESSDGGDKKGLSSSGKSESSERTGSPPAERNGTNSKQKLKDRRGYDERSKESEEEEEEEEEDVSNSQKSASLDETNKSSLLETRSKAKGNVSRINDTKESEVKNRNDKQCNRKTNELQDFTPQNKTTELTRTNNTVLTGGVKRKGTHKSNDHQMSLTLKTIKQNKSVLAAVADVDGGCLVHEAQAQNNVSENPHSAEDEDDVEDDAYVNAEQLGQNVTDLKGKQRENLSTHRRDSQNKAHTSLHHLSPWRTSGANVSAQSDREQYTGKEVPAAKGHSGPLTNCTKSVQLQSSQKKLSGRNGPPENLNQMEKLVDAENKSGALRSSKTNEHQRKGNEQNNKKIPAKHLDTDSDEEIKTSKTLSSDQSCAICLGTITDPKRLVKCGHVFCRECIDNCFKHYKPVCPSCNAVYGELTGNQPDGYMYTGSSGDRLPGYRRYETITITYHFPDGVQGENHPNPGQHYKGTTRRAYLPDCSEGREILELLKTAWDRKLIFTIGRSTTTGQKNVVTWNDIHHKTNKNGGPTRFGYPDPGYLSRVKEELASKGVTE